MQSVTGVWESTEFTVETKKKI